MKANNPIGIFDSGIGGLTVAHAITKVLPNESFVYFGDTAHLPYGDKSTAAIQSYTVNELCVESKYGMAAYKWGGDEFFDVKSCPYDDQANILGIW